MPYLKGFLLMAILMMSLFHCDEDNMLSLDWDAFDQTDYSGWRNLMYSGQHLAAADLIEKWIVRHPNQLNKEQLNVALFHQAQLYASGGRFDKAIALFEKCKREYVKETYSIWTGRGAAERIKNGRVGHWNAYVEANIAFLAKDKPGLIAARERLSKDVWGWQTVEIVDNMIDNFFSPATAGMDNIIQKNELRNNTRSIRIKSIDPDNMDFQDLKVLTKSIGDAQIVLLGAPSSGNGNALLAMSRLTKFLHQEMGFDVLVLETSWDEDKTTYQDPRSGKKTSSGPRANMPFGYGNIGQMQSLWQYIESKRETDEPLTVAGVDTVSNGAGIDQPIGKTTQQASGIGPDRHSLSPLDTGVLINNFEEKNRSMADKLIDLFENKHKGCQLIVWASSTYICRNLRAANQESTMALQFKVPTLGDLLKERYGKKLYALGFTSYEGKYRVAGSNEKVWDIPQAPEGSFEWLCHEAGVNNVFVDFRSIPDNHWLQKKVSMRLLENSNVELKWPEHMDGVLFIHTETPVAGLRSDNGCFDH